MNKLLHKPFKVFSLYALVILLFSIPVYYFVVDYIWFHELDEHNGFIKEQIEHNLNNSSIDECELIILLKNWNTLHHSAKLTPASPKEIRKDSTYTITQHKKIGNRTKVDRFRAYSSYIELKGEPYHLLVETNIEETDETIMAIGLVTLFFFILLVVGFIFLNKQIAKKIWQPFYKTLEQLKSFDLTSQQTISFDKSNIAEFQELNQTLYKLIEKNISVYTQQKTFIENASHELQTPLAVLRSKINLLLQNPAITNEQSKIITSIELPIARITRINKNLLLLAKIENQQFAEKEQLELTGIIDETHELLDDYVAEKKIKIYKKLDERLILECNKSLIEILINNLFINAIVHNIEKGKINIELSNRILTISNSGHRALNEQKIFERFAVSSSEKTSSGLGLAIVREICNRYRWKIDYTFENGFHSFSIKF